MADKLAPLGNAKNSILGNSNGYGIQMGILKEYATDIASLKTWLSNNPITVKYPLLDPMLVEITDQTLISQLDTMQKVLSHFAGTNITTISAEDLQPILNFDYKKSNRLKDKEQDARLDNIENKLALLES